MLFVSTKKLEDFQVEKPIVPKRQSVKCLDLKSHPNNWVSKYYCQTEV